jgi:V8-like Glu-specific endopeptidase
MSSFPVAVALTLVSMLVAGVPAAAAQSSGVGVAPFSARQALRFWTPARMRQARPMDIHMDGRDHAPVLPSGAPRRGTPGLVSPRSPRATASASSTFGEVADPTTVESRQNGVIFFDVGGFPARCSGTAVNAANFSVVITAGHCVYSGGLFHQWYKRRWVFVPGYRYGQRPFGVFPAKWIDATHQWVSLGSENFDVGAAVVMRNERGQRLGDAVGGAGIAWGLKANQVFDVHGYPAGPPFDGETQRLCPQTPFLGHDAQSFLFPGPLNLAVDCNVTGGASGGGWTIRGNVLNGVTDYGYPDDPATDFGAYFGREVARLYGRAARVH